MRKEPARTYIKRDIWHLGGLRKKKKDGFFIILGAIVKPLLLSVATGIGGYALKKRKKNFWVVKEE